MPPIPPHERAYGRGPRAPLPEYEPTHQEIFDAVIELRDTLKRIESSLRR